MKSCLVSTRSAAPFTRVVGVLVAVVLGWLFLPTTASGQAGYQIQGPYQGGNGGSSGRGSLYPASPYQQQGQPPAQRSAPKPQNQAYYPSPYGQQSSAGSQPYSYPAGQQPRQPAPRGQPQMPNYQYAPPPKNNGSRQVSQPVNGSGGTLAQEVADLKSRQRKLEQRIDALENKSTVGGGYVPSTPSSDKFIKHKVQYGDSLQGLADRYGTTPAQIKNTNHLSSNLLTEGQVLKIPSRSGPKEPTDTGRTHGGTHVVQRGESLGNVAAKYGVSSSALQKANSLRNPNLLVVGQKLSIPGRQGQLNSPATSRKSTIAAKTNSDGGKYVTKASKGKESASTSASPENTSGTISAPKGTRGITSYRVEAGDTIESVAHMFGTTAAEIQHKNKLSSPKLPPVGDEIVVPLPGSVTS